MPIPNISRQARIKGCSDSEAKALLDFLISVPDDTWFNSYEIYSDLKALLLDNFEFVRVVDGVQDFQNARTERMPNAIYKKLLIYTIINIHNYSTEEIMKINYVFQYMEQEAITGYCYVSIHGRSIKSIQSVLDKEGAFYEIIDYSDYLANNKLDRGIPIHNTIIVILTNKLIGL